MTAIMSPSGRIRVVTTFIFLIGFLLMVRLYYVQIVEGSTYEEKATRQYVHTSQDIFNRGTIYYTTKDGEKVGAASMKAGYVLAVNPEMITDAESVYEALDPHIDIDKIAFLEKATLANRTYVEIEPKLSEAAAAAIEPLDIDGVQLYRTQWRYYPGHEVGARSIGFIGYTDEGTLQRGKYGLESAYDEVLVRDDTALSVNFFAEIFSNLGNLVFDNEDAKEGDIVTTIEPTVARMLDRILMETQERYSSRLTGGIIMDPKTGEIRALNAVPTYDPNNRGDATIELFQNPLVENVYEMGSIIKALTVAAGLDSKVITPASTYYDPGFIELNTFTIKNFDGKGRGTVDMQQVLNQSLNTGVAHIVGLMGHKRFREYFTNLKLGSESGIDMPNEASGLVANLESPREVEYATASFGQGIAMTPIATVRALATLGNGGHLVTPHLVKKIEFEDGTEKEVKYPDGAQVFTPETSEAVSRMLANVVDEALRGGTVALPHHTIAAKTGTAEIAKPTGGYYDDRYLHSFFGYFPAYDPEFIVFLYTVEPKGVEYASETLTEPFMDLTTFLINYYNIPPDR
jgi:stage V sporulation protein D (sporulation-specific penicillin-binding protein)